MIAERQADSTHGDAIVEYLTRDLQTEFPGVSGKGKFMKLHIDKEAGALYLRLDDFAMVESEEISLGVVLDHNELNEVVGVEMLYLSK